MGQRGLDGSRPGLRAPAGGHHREEAAQRLLARATTVESALGRAVPWDTAAQAFIRAFETQLGLCFERGELTESEYRRAQELVSEKYDHPSWTERV